MRLLTFILIIATCSLTLRAQVAYSIRTDLEYPANLFSSIEKIDTHYYLSGLVATYESNFYPVKALLAQINTENGVIYDTTIYHGHFNKDYWAYNNSLIVTSNSLLAFTGYALTHGDSANMKILFVKYHPNGTILLTKEYSDINPTSYLIGRAMIETPDKGFLITGSIQYTTDFRTQVILLKIDSAGNQLWWREYGGTNYCHDAYSICKANDGNYLIGYQRNNASLRAPQQEEHSYTHILKVDSAGNELMDWAETDDSTYAPLCLINTSDGGYAYVSKYKEHQEGNTISYHARISKIDSIFNSQKIWDTLIGFPHGFTCLTKISESSTGNFVCTGTEFSFDAVENASSGWIVNLDANGNVIWDRKYQAVNSLYETNQINDFEILPDGGILCVGEATDHYAPTHGTQGWILRLDSNGCLLDNCGLYPLAVEEVSSETPIELKTYPNPFSQQLNINLTAPGVQQYDIEISTLLGQPVIAVTNLKTSTYTVNTEALPQGIYLVYIKANGQKLGAGKIIKQ